MSALGVYPYLAHLGHWYISLPVYMAPIIVLVVWLKVGEWRDRARERASREKAR